MEVNSLRIGNLVTWKDQDDESNAILTLTGIVLGDCIWVEWVWENGESDNTDCDLDTIKGIRLTEDWLRLFNFKYHMKNISGHPEKEHMVRRWQYKFFINGNEWWFDFEVNQKSLGNFFWLWWNFGGSNHFVHLPRKIEYVHELQNLYFALTGEELKLKN